MMKIAKESVYKLLGYICLGIGAYAVFNANNTNLQATAPLSQQQTPYKRNRHTITLELSQLPDLKVEEGQRINVAPEPIPIYSDILLLPGCCKLDI